ncbi:MAG: glycosyl transferase [Piscirickettsiaceae bacterium]|nr:glycosyl transferase [Piscirickettsiaceae bacterium]
MTALTAAIKKVATGPHLNKDLSQKEAFDAMTEILSGQADEVQAAIFFIALRIKRETNDENLGILQAIQAQTQQESADIDQLLILSDPYNGYNRHCPITAFLPAVLAASGLPTISQGVNEMGPKFGVTHSQVLDFAGVATNLSIKQARDRLNNPELSWAYIDQAQASPNLYALQTLRTRMIKRPSLSTLEKLVMPIKAKLKTHLQIGFVHKEYPPILARLAQQVGFSSALIIRGIEGGILPTLRETSNCFILRSNNSNEAQAYLLDPTEFGIHQSTRGVLPAISQQVTAEETADLGLKALAGQSGVAFDSLVLGGAMALYHCGLQASPQQAADYIRQNIKSGKANSYFMQRSH